MEKEEEQIFKNTEKIVDQVTQKVLAAIGRTYPGRKIRNSQVLSILAGFVGFAMFLDGMQKFFSEFPRLYLVIGGFLLMALAGVLLQKLSD